MKSTIILGLLRSRTPAGIGMLITRVYVLFGVLLVLSVQWAMGATEKVSLVGLISSSWAALSIIAASSMGLYHLAKGVAQEVFSLHEDIIESQMEILNRLTIASEFRDGSTRAHTLRVGHYCQLIAAELGIDPARGKLLYLAAQLHDIGKVGIPDAVLLKPGALSTEERQTMQTHVEIGGRLLSGGGTNLMKMCEDVIWSHHERWDGSGYPNQLRGEEIPIEGRIVAVADVFDALCSARPYKSSWSMDDAAARIAIESGTHFDPGVVEAFERALPKLKLIAAKSTEDDRPDLEVLPEVTRAELMQAMREAA
ncbi:MAG: HD domain-containing protein [Chthonomonas sp.]|nr:HD domain-containing protein [Chthonomonas sp.]